MATLTIRDLDEALKRSLRLRAASRNRSMEEEARQILRAALLEAPASAEDLVSRIRARFAGLGDVELPIAKREPMREPPVFDKGTRTVRRSPSGGSARMRRRA
jgi:plasmid stability protein